MEDEIINRVASSSLEVFDLEDFYPEGPRIGIDIANWLVDGFLLIEKQFRQSLKEHDWATYSNSYVAVYCSSDAIIPAWAEILVTVHASAHAKRVVSGTPDKIDAVLYDEILSAVDFEQYAGKAVIIKGCARKPVPNSAYVLAAQKLRPIAKSIMYGEACSAVPLFKRGTSG